MTRFYKSYSMKTAALIPLVASGFAAPITEITLPGTRVFPESITSTADGTLIVGSIGHRNVMRIAAGKTVAEEWIKPGTGGLAQVFGVYADEKGKTFQSTAHTPDGAFRLKTETKLGSVIFNYERFKGDHLWMFCRPTRRKGTSTK